MPLPTLYFALGSIVLELQSSVAVIWGNVNHLYIIAAVKLQLQSFSGGDRQVSPGETMRSNRPCANAV